MTKLNAEELAAKRYPNGLRIGECQHSGYAAAIREVAQPIADERDELRNALERLLAVAEATTFSDQYPQQCHFASAILAKYPKP